ncbi:MULTISPECIES: 3-oxoadipyl-CoA thiolase [unclassified Lentimicrobium]|uniref:3-oxoadipyl-CoA thiolase n=1 Tax=unclassified Lentimicrobium TaxID=2677434 RepID=UPI00155497D2|nr:MULTISPECIES: 3-oxoadipyl-CoA thiolase [unclassified Lentimicrobium]NPD43965.1 3-oxoadipyl-CoA thiolase [Lentimicrobium sp. S6]NPD84180.1 3-oxoadipyl-CoA thiolase [Lentimicrobium sp. L6]
MKNVYICDAIRTPVGRYGGSLASLRADDLAAIPLKTLMDRNPEMDWTAIDDVLMGCANQAGEDNRNVGRMASLLSGLPETVPANTINRLCGSGMDAIGSGARAIKAGEAELIIAGGVESMSRAPFVIGKAEGPYGRSQKLEDTTMGWRFINKKLDQLYGTEGMMMTAQNIADDFNINREDQDKFAKWSQDKAQKAQENGSLAREIISVEIPQRKKDPIIFSADEHPRPSTLEKLASLKALTGTNGCITAGNASGINDGAGAMLLASEEAVKKYGLNSKVKILGMATAGVLPRIMGMGPVPATRKVLKLTGLSLDDMDIIELNEAFAAQSLGCTRELGLADDDARINPLGGAIALGHPLGMSGMRIVTSAYYQLINTDAKYALCTMCIGVGQGIAVVLEKV